MEFKQLYEELSNSTEMIRSLLADVSQEQASLKPDAGSWSTLEVVCHLYDEEREDFREHLGFILHRQHEAWHQINPQGWLTERKYNQQDFRIMKDKFFNERQESLDWLTSLANADWELSYTTEFRTMNAGDMFAAWIAHDNLHIRQLVELRRYRIENLTNPYDIQYAGDW
jgi:hypothetical protein